MTRFSLLAASGFAGGLSASATTATGESSPLVTTGIPDPESVRDIPELAWHAWRADIQDPKDCVIICWVQLVFRKHVAHDASALLAQVRQTVRPDQGMPENGSSPRI